MKKINITSLSDTQLLENLSVSEREHALHLTEANRLFYIRLIRLCEQEGCYDGSGYYLAYSVDKFAEAMGISRRSATYSLAHLSACSAIIRDKTKTFPVEPSRTFLNKELLEGRRQK